MSQPLSETSKPTPHTAVDVTDGLNTLTQQINNLEGEINTSMSTQKRKGIFALVMLIFIVIFEIGSNIFISKYASQHDNQQLVKMDKLWNATSVYE